MKMLSRPYWLRRPVDVRIVDVMSATAGGFCTIKSVDFYEDMDEQDDEELASFPDVYQAFDWLAANGYAPVESGCADGIYRHTKAAEWFYEQLSKPPVRVVKRVKERVPLSPLQERIMLMIAA